MVKIGQQLEYLKKETIYGNNKDYFKVINIEAGLGKSLTTEEALVELYKINKNIKSIYVTKFKDTVNSEDIVDELETSQNRINALAGCNIAMSIHSDNYTKLKDKLDRFPILIITHERYKILSKDLKQRKLFTKDRTNLIIDEEIDMLEIYTYNLKRIEWFDSVLPRSLRVYYNNIIKEIENYLKTKKGKSFFNAKNKLEEELKEFKKLLKYNITKEYANQFKLINEETQMKKYDFLKEVDIINEFLNKTCVCDGNNIYTYNSKIEYWLLENNIILDANAGFNYIYQLNDLFKVQKQSKVINHSNWTLHIANINSTKSKKSKAINYHREIEKHILKYRKSDDKILIIGNKEDEEKIKIENVTKDHFGNIIGRNDWKHYNKLYITHTPNIPFWVYVLKYLYYSKKKLDNRSNWNIIRKENIAGFRNKHFDKIRITYLASELYQAIKRINRDNTLKTDVYIFNNDDKVIDLVIKQLKNAKVENFSINVEYETNKNKKDKLDNLTYAEKFIMLLSELESGKYKKKWLRRKLQIKDKNNFRKYVLNNADVLKYMKDNNIINQRQDIIIV